MPHAARVIDPDAAALLALEHLEGVLSRRVALRPRCHDDQALRQPGAHDVMTVNSGTSMTAGEVLPSAMGG